MRLKVLSERQFRRGAHALRTRSLACEYAKCQKGLSPLQPGMTISAMRYWTSHVSRSCARNRAMSDQASVPDRKNLPPAAQRALDEAEARRQAAASHEKAAPKELQGPKGPEPTR